MPDPLAHTISKLSSRELQSVASGIADVVRAELADVYKDDSAALAALQRVDPAQASNILDALVPALDTGRLPLDDEALRQLLLALAEQPEFEPYVRRALERRLLVSLDPVVLGTLLVLLLSVKWKVKVSKTKEGGMEFELEASKTATPVDFIRTLLARIPGWGAVAGTGG